MMRALAAVAVMGLVLALAACGGSEREAPMRVKATGTPPPVGTPEPLHYVGDARTALKGGAIAVVDNANRVAVAPARMDVNREQTLSGLRWSAWGSKFASARGDVTTLICDPTCAQGINQESRAKIVLSAPKRCGDRRFYTRSSMTYEDPETGETRAPATYLRTPAC